MWKRKWRPYRTAADISSIRPTLSRYRGIDRRCQRLASDLDGADFVSSAAFGISFHLDQEINKDPDLGGQKLAAEVERIKAESLLAKVG